MILRLSQNWQVEFDGYWGRKRVRHPGLSANILSRRYDDELSGRSGFGQNIFLSLTPRPVLHGNCLVSLGTECRSCSKVAAMVIPRSYRLTFYNRMLWTARSANRLSSERDCACLAWFSAFEHFYISQYSDP